MKTTGHSSAWDDVRIIYRENNWKILENSLNDDLTKIKNLLFLKVFIRLIFNILIKINYYKLIVFKNL